MPKTIKYIGSQSRWPELSATGKQAVWYPGQQEERSDSDAAALIATGFFDNLSDDFFTPAAASALNALVSDARITTSANAAALVAAGIYTAFFTDVGVGGGSWWYYSGGRWRRDAPVLLKNGMSNPSNNTSTKTVLDYCAIPTVLFRDGDSLRLDFIKEKTGGTLDTDQTDVLIGTAPTTVGSTLWDASNGLTSALATTSLVLRPAPVEYRRESATTIRPLAPNGGTQVGTSSAANSVKTVPNMDSQATYLQITSKLTSAAGEVVWLRGFNVWMICGGN